MVRKDARLFEILVINQMFCPLIVFVYKSFANTFKFHAYTFCKFYRRGIIQINMGFYTMEFQMHASVENRNERDIHLIRNHNSKGG
ncbi:hypothetical protein DET54_104204 [Paenibacillus pabuli]|uniref:Uncharacterized protein n=1 Tax=Paenibacillus pabuli TaxID=1472 RepID=A0A855XUJ3_9BACL|nr:hypothetical protein DET56_111198 [Paenibacillus pabuli]PXW03244.1 hypothetical protein DEU73_110198 [Paenibacillus taichungensis]RAI98148.1 hypothetical protein DET54_104204 [Paenibacillus pabuli]